MGWCTRVTSFIEKLSLGLFLHHSFKARKKFDCLTLMSSFKTKVMGPRKSKNATKVATLNMKQSLNCYESSYFEYEAIVKTQLLKFLSFQSFILSHVFRLKAGILSLWLFFCFEI